MQPDDGSVRVRGRVAGLIEVGAGLHPDLTGRENIFLNAAILGMSKAETEAKYDAIVAFSEIEKFLDTQVKFYSSGMFMRLGFSVAVHTEPDIFLVDEVLAVGDPPFQKKCLERIQELHADGRTLVIVSHDMGTLEKVCGRGIVLREGRAAYEGGIEGAVDFLSPPEGALEEAQRRRGTRGGRLGAGHRPDRPRGHGGRAAAFTDPIATLEHGLSLAAGPGGHGAGVRRPLRPHAAGHHRRAGRQERLRLRLLRRAARGLARRLPEGPLRRRRAAGGRSARSWSSACSRTPCRASWRPTRSRWPSCTSTPTCTPRPRPCSATSGPRLRPGSVIVFDEYFNYPGWREHEYRAWQEYVAASGARFEYEAYTSGNEQVVVRITDV